MEQSDQSEQTEQPEQTEEDLGVESSIQVAEFSQRGVAAREVLESERVALLETFTALRGREWVRSDGWCRDDVPVEEWFGVHVYQNTKTVRAIVLPRNRLVGAVPDAIADLQDLQILVLNDNPVTSLPDSLCRCTKLSIVKAKRTALSSFPLGLANMHVTCVYLSADVTARAKPFLERAVEEHENTFAMNALALYYIQNEEDEGGLEKGKELFERAASTGCANSEFNMATMLQYGDGCEKDTARAAQLYERAGRAGHGRAMYQLGDLFLIGNGVERSPAKAITWYKHAALINECNSLNRLGLLHDNGNHVAQNPQKAFAYYKRSAEQDHVDAHFNLAQLCRISRRSGELGLSEQECLELAHKHFHLAAQLGDMVALHMQANMIDRGLGLPKPDPQLAAELSRLAVFHMDAEPLLQLGIMYSGNRGSEQVTRDEERARLLFHQALDNKPTHTTAGLWLNSLA